MSLTNRTEYFKRKKNRKLSNRGDSIEKLKINFGKTGHIKHDSLANNGKQGRDNGSGILSNFRSYNSNTSVLLSLK